MSRFLPALRYTWLACWRARLPRDLRNLIVNGWVRRNLFRWETEELLAQRVEVEWDLNSGIRYFARMRLFRELVSAVERCAPLPFPNDEEHPVQLHRVRIKARPYQLEPQWLWLY